MKNFLKYNWPSILWAAFILGICLLPGSNLPKVRIPNLDKGVHFFSYLVFAFLLSYGWQKQTFFSSLREHTYFRVLATAALYGLTIEVLQSFTGREFSWWDELANVIGALGGTYYYYRFFRRQKNFDYF